MILCAPLARQDQVRFYTGHLPRWLGRLDLQRRRKSTTVRLEELEVLENVVYVRAHTCLNEDEEKQRGLNLFMPALICTLGVRV
jgi:hypothetical protein